MDSLSALQSDTLILDWLAGINDGVLRRCSSPVPDTPWYLLSSAWLNQWKAKFSSSAPQSIPSIDNSQLLLHIDRLPLEEVCDLLKPIKTEFISGRDFAVVPEKAWTHFVQVYGCEAKSEIKRRSQPSELYKTSVETHLQAVSVAFVSKTEHDIQLTALKSAYFSRLDTFHFIKTTLKTYFLKDLSDSKCEYLARLWLLTSSVPTLESKLSTPSSELLFPGQLLTDEIRLCDLANNSDKNTVIICEIRERGEKKLFYSLHEMPCSACSLQIGQAGIICACNEAYFCDKICMSRHKCAFFSPANSEEDLCAFCGDEIVGTVYNCPCMDCMYCDERCYRRDTHRCRQVCEKCKEVVTTAVKCTCGEMEYCSSLCALSHECWKEKCPTCHNPLPTDSILCRCGTVRVM